jgi:hypothetical protein
MESALLSLLGGGLGIALAHGALRVVQTLAATSIPFIREAGVDGTVILFTAGVSLLTALICGLFPALRQSRAAVAEVLRTGTRSTGGPQIRTWQQSLLVGQIAAVLVLLASAGLLLESFRRLTGQDLGYQPRPVITMDLGQSGFDTNGDVCRMYRALRERLAALPGVEAVGTISSAPLTGKWTFNERPDIAGQSVGLGFPPYVCWHKHIVHSFQFLSFILKPADIIPNTHPNIFLGYRISRAGTAPSRKLRRSMRESLRAAADKSPDHLVRSLHSYRGLLSF